MDFKQFKKVGDDEKTITLRHDKGHEVRIMKHALDPKMRKALSAIPTHEPENYADGGEIEDPTKNVSPASDTQAREPVAPAAQPPVTINIQQPGGAPPPVQQQQPWEAADPKAAALETLPSAEEGKQAAAKLLTAGPPVTDAALSGREPTPEERSAAALQPPPQPAAAPAPAAPQPEAGLASAAAPELPSPADVAAQNYQKALDLGMKGIDQQAKAESHLATAKQGISHQAAESTATLEDELRAKLQENGDEIDAITDDIKKGHINPNQYLENRTAGQKIGHFIGLILGGIGGGLTHTENPVLGLINQQIDRDLEAQKKNLDNKNNLLAALMHKEGNIRAASDMFRVIRANTIAHQLDEAAAAAGTPLAQARANQGKSGLLEKYGPLQMRGNLLSAVSKLSKSGDVDAVGKMLPQLRVYDPAMAKELESRYVPGVGTASVPLDQNVRGKIEAGSGFLEKVRKFRSWAKQHEGTVTDRAAVSYGQTLSSDLQQAYRQATNGGVFKPSEAEFINKLIPADPTAFFNKLRVDPKLRALEDSVLQDHNHLRKSVGLPSYQVPAEVRVMNGVPYVRVGGGWKRKQ